MKTALIIGGGAVGAFLLYRWLTKGAASSSSCATVSKPTATSSGTAIERFLQSRQMLLSPGSACELAKPLIGKAVPVTDPAPVTVAPKILTAPVTRTGAVTLSGTTSRLAVGSTYKGSFTV